MPNKKQLDPYSPGGCFIATACYGSEFTTQVMFLKEFRDNFLAKFFLGQKFIENYYKYSPDIAESISKSRITKLLTRFLIVEPSYLFSKFLMNFKRLFD
ncbi:MAG: CFI-box-CTERM domain-containing protein [Candidatus Aenigmatarchaeota archaeon]